VRLKLSWSSCLAALLLIPLFCLPALYNRHPVLYPDSVGYFHSGSAALDALAPVESAVEDLAEGKAHAASPLNRQASRPAEKTMAERSLDGTSTSRSPYYGVLLVVLTHLGGEWALPLVQVVLSIMAIMLAARHLGRPRTLALFSICAITGLVAGLGIFSTTIMPDVFAGLAILATALLITAFRSMSGKERCFWLTVLLASCLFHKANLATSAMLAMLGIGYCWLTARVDKVLAASLFGVLAAAVIGHMVVNIAVEKTSGRPPIQTPFLLARLVGDGTAEQYLRKHCPQAGYALCRFLPRMPMSENDFLWSSVPPKTVMKTAPVETQSAIAAQSNAIIRGVLTEFPLQQAKASSENAIRQLFDVGIREYGLGIAGMQKDDSAMAPILQAYSDSRIAEGSMPLGAMSTVMLIAYIAGFGALAALFFSRSRRMLPAQAWKIVGIVVTGIVINALISGVIAGVFDRYQGRVAWLIPFVALLLWYQRGWPTTTSPGERQSRPAPQ
jgi:hypothetical protein